MSWPIEPSKLWEKPRDNLLMERIRAAQQQYGYFNSQEYLAIAALASHYVVDPEGLSDVAVPEHLEWLNKIAPNLANSSDDIFDQANTFVVAFRENGYKLKQAAENSPGDLEKMLEEAKQKQQQMRSGGKKGGPPSDDHYAANWDYWLTKANGKGMPNLGKSKLITRSKATRSSEFEEGEPPKKIKRTVMRHTSHLRYLTLDALGMEDDQFFQAFLEKKLTIDLPIKEVQNKQTLMVLVDRSGSMDTPDKMSALAHILDQLFQQVLLGNTKLMFAYFTYAREKFIQIETAKDVLHFKQHIFASPCGGMTQVGEILKQISDDIVGKGNVDGFKVDRRTEIVVINDGEDPVSILPLKIPVTAFTLDERNPELVALTRSTGGEAYHVKGGNFQLL